MKNADMPAMPTHDVFEHCGFDGNSGPHLTQTTNYGLTKREMMAMHMMAGLNANPTVEMNEHDMATLAVTYADALLWELDITSK